MSTREERLLPRVVALNRYLLAELEKISGLNMFPPCDVGNKANLRVAKTIAADAIVHAVRRGLPPRLLDMGTFGGQCARSVCTNDGATYFNHSTRQYYCADCAWRINCANHVDAMRLYGHDLCTPPKIPLGDAPMDGQELFEAFLAVNPNLQDETAKWGDLSKIGRRRWTELAELIRVGEEKRHAK